MHHLTVQLNNLISFIIIALVGFTPLIFSNYTTEYFESTKVILLVASTLVLYLLWSFKWVLAGKVTFTKTPLDLPLLLLLIVVIISTIFSPSRSDAIFGNFPRVDGSAVSWVSYILFYFVAVSHIKSFKQIKAMLYVLLASASLIAVSTLASYFGLFLPWDFTKAVNFTPTGSSFSTAALLLLLLPTLILTTFQLKKPLSLGITTALTTLFITTILLIGGSSENSWKIILSPVYLVLYFTLFITFLIIKRDQFRSKMIWFFLPIAISLVVLSLGYLPFNNNPLAGKRLDFPREIQLPFNVSWQVSGQSFVKDPFWGSGPSTYGFNFTSYKNQDFNLNQFWNLRFDTAFNEYLQILGTLGALGFLAFFAFVVLIINLSLSSILHSEDNLVRSLASASLIGVVLLLIHTSTPVLMVVILAFLAMLMGVHKQSSGKVEELSIGIRASKITDSNLIVGDILPIIIFIPVLVLSLIIGWNLVKAVRADIYHRQALNAASSRGIDTYNLLIQAEKLNPHIALYRTDLAQTNFALANSLALAKGPTEASPAGSLTDEDKKVIQQLLSQAINESRVATTLSPRSSQNWVILANIYRQISGVAQNATDFSLDAYGRAIQRDPTNPILRLNVGGIYYSIKNYELATRFFVDAASLKEDYANAYYNLSITLRDKGDLPQAYTVGQQVLTLLQNDPNNPDFKAASEYLADLKIKLEEKQRDQVAGASEVTPPAAEQNSPLQKDNLPNVVDLGQKPEVATPEAVKNDAKPTANPSPNPQF